MAFPTLSYAVVLLTKDDYKHIKTGQMKFMRSLAGYTFRIGKRNYDVRKELS